jgi:small subunit ribosomal protein S6
MPMADDGRRLYEGLFLLDPAFANKDPEGALALCQGVLEKYGALVIRMESWGEQKLAYEIRKNKRGAYVLAAFRAEPLKLGEIELECRLTERILRYLFLNRDGVPMEKWFRRYESQRGARPREAESEGADTEAEQDSEREVETAGAGAE